MATAPVELPPADLAERLFGVDIWDTPRSILDAAFEPGARVAVKACHASSKTHTAAIAAALALYEGGDVLTTAPTWEQVRTVLWGEIRRLIANSVIDWTGRADINQTHILTRYGAQALGLSTNEGVRFQGFHARPGSFLLVILDEAPGVMPEIYEAIAGISAGGDVRRLLIGNPVLASGPFYDIFTGESPGWERFTIDAFDTPNLRGVSLPDLLRMDGPDLDADLRPYLVTRRWVRDRHAEWGEDHPLWQSRVRGRFPTQSDDALLSLAWLEAAAGREARFDPDGPPLVAGIDVAGPGEDETVLAIRQGPALLALEGYAHDARGAVLARLKPLHRNGWLGQANVDVAGIGYYFAQHLRDERMPVREVNVGEAPTTNEGKEKYRNLKAELYWAFRARCAEGDFAWRADRRALAQLAAIRYEHDARGRVEIETKEQLRKRRGAAGGWSSPDRAEAIILAFAPDDPRQGWAEAVGKSAPIIYDADRKSEPNPFGRLREEMAVERRRKQEARHG